MGKRISPQIHKTYTFLKQASDDNRQFTINELYVASGWSRSTFDANRTKKLIQCIRSIDDKYETCNMENMTLETFSHICSQNSKITRDPDKPDLKPAVEERLIKARDATLAAVQHYNNPTALFKSDTYIVLMIIAFTSLFHALCERDGIDYREKKNDGTPKLTGSGYPLLFDALACANKLTNYVTPPMIKNLEIMMGLRHKIEHRCVSQIDAQIAGNCQSMLLNFENILTKQFTIYYSLNASLCFPLFFSTERSQETINSMRSFQSAEYEKIVKFIKDYHATLSDEIMTSPEFAFRVYLIPMTVNNVRKSDKSIEFIPLSSCTPELLSELEQSIIAIRDKRIEVRNKDNLKPKAVCKIVEESTCKRFTMNDHTKAWKRHRVRPLSTDSDKESTEFKYCIYDIAFKAYVYTPAWVELLISELKDT